MRAIDADGLMEQLQKKKCGAANKRYVEGFNDCLMRVRSMVHSAPTLTPPNEWVSVEERQLEPGQRVIATDGDFVGEAYVTENGLWVRFAALLWETAFNSPVTHWMPLPAPPEGEEAAP